MDEEGYVRFLESQGLSTNGINTRKSKANDVMNIIGVIETRYDVEIPTRDAWKLITVKDAIQYMEKKGLKF